ncbi:hypothetical protein OEZ85_012995 [Tetradesmus obliquus]|uniref:VWFA domain-containing protein n=1 Tax=Tetradesmus obliquus TaxID=3088 RepID=A0ABY8U7A8_TETOB|nr:hypothetical protein OEZ85_012995 [Tetradesmus obliquus]
MSTLERSKAYDAKLHPHQLGDRTDERINSPTPHQAPQRERVSLSTRPRQRSSRGNSPDGQRPNSWGNAGKAAKAATWRERIRPDVNMGVPTLLMLLEPDVVWQHAAAYHGHARHTHGRAAEAAACQGIFFDGHDQMAKLSHGVYEGSYWQLLGDLEEIEAMLSRMTQAPSLLEEPELQLPPELDLPKWEQFKPELVPLPEAPAAPAAPTLPPFVEPDLPDTVQLAPPELLAVPPLPPAWKEVVAPVFVPPPAPQQERLQLPELMLPPAPVLKEPAKPPPANPAKHGHDWSGKRPFTVPAPSYVAPQLPPAPEEVLPESQQQALEQLREAWQQVQAAPIEAAGTPHVWLDFKAPFADPPPVFVPKKPEPGPEPQLVLPTDLQEAPLYQPPVPQPMPDFVEPPMVLPKWAAPCEPLPVGFLRGTAPVLIMDVSGTMHPARRGQFLRVKKCVCQLLEPEGELATAGTAFDVLAFSGACWSFSAAWAGKQALLASAMQEHLTEAQSWVQNWPEAVGNTRLLTALITAQQYTFTGSSGADGSSIDCYYLFSDGLADDAAACLEWVRQQEEAGQPLRPVHTVGFFPRNGCPSGERFLSQLAAATGGTFQIYNADLPIPAAAANIVRNATAAAAAGAGGASSSQNAAGAAGGGEAASAAAVGGTRVWDDELGAFVAVDLAKEDAATRDERLWAEQQMTALRLANKRTGRVQTLAAMLNDVRQQHQQQRVLPAMAAHQARLQQLRAAHAAACAAVTRANEMAVRQAMRSHSAAVQQVKSDNDRKVAAAHQAHEDAVWQQQVQQLESAARQVYEQALSRAGEENAKLAQLHEQEVQEKLAGERQHAQMVAEHAAAQAAALRQHEVALAAAKVAHAAAAAAAELHWRQQQEQQEAEHQQQLQEAQQQHAQLVQQVKEQNRLAREAHKQAAEAHRAAAVENRRRLALAEEQQAAAAAQLAADNAAALQQARQDYKMLCQHMQEAHEQHLEAVQQQWLAAKAAAQQRSDEATAAARARYAAAVEAGMQQHEAQCDTLREQHAAQLARVRTRNQEILPQVQVAQLAATELGRVKIFAAHLRRCAAKLQLGVNFLADTPNLDRVVEMSALTDGLKAAFAEVQEPRDYPWPALLQRQQRQQWDSKQPVAALMLDSEAGADGAQQQLG